MICNPMVNCVLVVTLWQSYIAVEQQFVVVYFSMQKMGKFHVDCGTSLRPRKILMDGIASTMSYVLFNTRVLKMNMVLCADLHLLGGGFKYLFFIFTPTWGNDPI